MRFKEKLQVRGNAYWIGDDDSDAAVVFERRDTRSGERRYVYHGNDGTSFPWNDTAQLDFLKAEHMVEVKGGSGVAAATYQYVISTKGSELVVYETNGALHRQSLAVDVA